MKVKIRKEQIKDFYDISEVNYKAFLKEFQSNYVSENGMIDCARRLKDFDGDFSLVAEIDGIVVGHILLIPLNIIINGKVKKAVSLGPVSVIPELQGKKIGQALIEKSHQLAKEKGYDLSFLFGHDTYYPRFGYIPHTVGESFALIEVKDKETTTLKEKSIIEEDIPFIHDLYMKWFENVDLTVLYDPSLMSYVSHSPSVEAFILLKEGNRIGYVRYKKNEENNPLLCLAKDQESFDEILNYLKDKSNKETIKFPIHHDSLGYQLLSNYQHEYKNSTFSAGMILNLSNDKCVEDYIENAKSSKKTGLMIYPTSLDIVY
ncbi:N-acetyltransferase [Mycoplasmatota bacterium zrk1]